MRNKSNGVKKGQNVAARKREVNKGESSDQGKIVPYEESFGYRCNTYV